MKEANEYIATLDRKEKPLPDDPEDNIIVTAEERARIKSMTGQVRYTSNLELNDVARLAEEGQGQTLYPWQ